VTDMPTQQGTKKRVLIVYRSYFPSLSHLGPATAIRNLTSNMSGDYDFHILTLNHEFASGARLFEEAVHCEIVGSAMVEYIPRGLRGLLILLRRLRSDFDVVDIQCAFDPLLSMPALLLCWLGIAGGSRIFHTPHGIFMDVIMSAGSLKKWLFCRLTDILGLYRRVVHLAGSPGEEDDIRRNHRRAQNVRMVSQFVESAVTHRVIRQKPAATLNIAFVGRVTVQKNLAFAIEALRQLPVPSTFDIFGELGNDAYARQCIEMIEAGVGRCKVTFKGNLAKQDLFRQLSRYDILLHPTLGENFGHAIVEALTVGLPVLISDKSPWTDVAEQNAGWSLPLSQPSAFSDKLKAIYEMGDGWSAMSDGAIRYSRATFDGGRTTERYRGAYG
jgi:glycosyltransferase involved in cell wall biosynthesis